MNIPRMDVSSLPYIVRVAAMSGLLDYIDIERRIIEEHPGDPSNEIRQEHIDYYNELIRQLSP